MLLVYGEDEYRSVCDGGLRLYDYSKVALPEACDAGGDAALALLFRKLKSRAVVIWPESIDDGFAHAYRHAAMLAEAGVPAVGVVETPDDYDPGKARACADEALRSALVRAWPAQGARPARGVPPWSEPLDGAAMFTAVRGVLARVLAEPPASLDAIALWCLHAWLAQSGGAPFDVSPRLVLHANDARADHARALRAVAWLTPSPLIVSRAIAAHLLPLVEAERPTLLLDDVGGGLLYRRDMRSLIAAGALRDGIFLSATTKRNRTGRSSCFAPTAMATTGFLPDDLRMRSIVVPMAPVPAGEARVQSSFSQPPGEVLALRAQMQAFAAEAARAMPAVEAMPARNLCAAARENWAPLFAVALCIGARVAERAVEAAEALSDVTPAPASNLALLADIRAAFGVDVRAHLPTARIIDTLTADPERPWTSSRRGRKLDARELAERLANFGLRPMSLKMPDDVVVRGYRGEGLADAFARYLCEPLAGSGTVAAE